MAANPGSTPTGKDKLSTKPLKLNHKLKPMDTQSWVAFNGEFRSVIDSNAPAALNKAARFAGPDYGTRLFTLLRTALASAEAAKSNPNQLRSMHTATYAVNIISASQDATRPPSHVPARRVCAHDGTEPQPPPQPLQSSLTEPPAKLAPCHINEVDQARGGAGAGVPDALSCPSPRPAELGAREAASGGASEQPPAEEPPPEPPPQPSNKQRELRSRPRSHPRSQATGRGRSGRSCASARMRIGAKPNAPVSCPRRRRRALPLNVRE